MYKYKKDLFSTGELSKLCSISRKTLLFYDRIGLIAPAFVDEENGYRYYARRQLHTLELIINLRNLNISLSDIQSYLKNKSLNNYKQLLVNQDALIKDAIFELQKTRQDLHHQIESIKKSENTVLDKFFIEDTEEEYLFTSKDIQKGSTMKTRNKVYGLHFADLQKHVRLANYMTGYILSCNFENEEPTWQIKNFYHYLDKKISTPFLHVKPSGRYLCFYHKGIFCSTSRYCMTKMNNYLHNNSLSVENCVYVTQLTNYWVANNGDDYITKLSVRLL